MTRLPNQFTRGQRFNPNSSDANRLLRLAREADQGAGNLTTSEIRAALEAGHVFVKNNTGATVERFSVLGLGDRLYAFRLDQRRISLEFNAWNGDTLNLKRHWFHHGVTQQTVANGEIVRVAINGLTFVKQKDGEPGSRNEGLHNYALSPSAQCMEPAVYGHHAKCIAVSDSFSITKDLPGVCVLGQSSRVWACILESRTSDEFLSGYLEQYGTGSSKQTITVWDRYDLLPNTLDLPIGSLDNLRVAVEISQENTKTDIFGVLLTIPRNIQTLGLETVTAPPPPP